MPLIMLGALRLLVVIVTTILPMALLGRTVDATLYIPHIRQVEKVFLLSQGRIVLTGPSQNSGYSCVALMNSGYEVKWDIDLGDGKQFHNYTVTSVIATDTSDDILIYGSISNVAAAYPLIFRLSNAGQILSKTDSSGYGPINLDRSMIALPDDESRAFCISVGMIEYVHPNDTTYCMMFDQARASTSGRLTQHRVVYQDTVDNWSDNFRLEGCITLDSGSHFTFGYTDNRYGKHRSIMFVTNRGDSVVWCDRAVNDRNSYELLTAACYANSQIVTAATQSRSVSDVSKAFVRYLDSSGHIVSEIEFSENLYNWIQSLNTASDGSAVALVGGASYMRNATDSFRVIDQESKTMTLYNISNFRQVTPVYKMDTSFCKNRSVMSAVKTSNGTHIIAGGQLFSKYGQVPDSLVGYVTIVHNDVRVDHEQQATGASYKLFPNPSYRDNSINIWADDVISDVAVQTVIGQEIYHVSYEYQSQKKCVLNLPQSAFPAGVYYLRLNHAKDSKLLIMLRH